MKDIHPLQTYINYDLNIFSIAHPLIYRLLVTQNIAELQAISDIKLQTYAAEIPMKSVCGGISVCREYNTVVGVLVVGEDA